MGPEQSALRPLAETSRRSSTSERGDSILAPINGVAEVCSN